MKKYNIIILIIIILFSISCNTTNVEDTVYAKKVIQRDTVQIKLLYAQSENEIEYDLSDYFDLDIIERYDAEIQKFMLADMTEMPETGQILFVGSSSIRTWKTLHEDMPSLDIVQRGFGGATIPEVIHYSDLIVFPYEPSKIVFYCGENDHYFHNSEMVFETFQIFEKLLHKQLNNTELYFLSIKPSPARFNRWKAMSTTNRLIKQYCRITEKTYYIDIVSDMMDENSKLKTDIFRNDKLHLNKKGYEIWTKIIFEKIN